jgi:hypothetical protein
LARAEIQTAGRLPILFVECNGPEVEQYASVLEEQLPDAVEAVLLETLEHRTSERDLPRRSAVTTFYHGHEVERSMEPRGGQSRSPCFRKRLSTG